MNRKLICQILNHEMMLATGCTEPAAIALTAAIAREQLDGELEQIGFAVNNMFGNVSGMLCDGAKALSLIHI